MPMQGDAPLARRVRITVGLEKPDYDALTAVAEQEDRSLSWLVAQAVKSYLRERDRGFQYRLQLDAEQAR